MSKLPHSKQRNFPFVCQWIIMSNELFFASLRIGGS